MGRSGPGEEAAPKAPLGGPSRNVSTNFEEGLSRTYADAAAATDENTARTRREEPERTLAGFRSRGVHSPAPRRGCLRTSGPECSPLGPGAIPTPVPSTPRERQAPTPCVPSPSRQGSQARSTLRPVGNKERLRTSPESDRARSASHTPGRPKPQSAPDAARSPLLSFFFINAEGTAVRQRTPRPNNDRR